MKKLLTLSTLALGALIAASGQASAANLVIDHFTAGSVSETIKGTDAVKTKTGTVAGPEIGGTRAYEFTQTLGTTVIDESKLTVDGVVDYLEISNSFGANSTTEISYPAISGTAIDGPGFFNFEILGGDATATDSTISLTVNGVTVTKTPSVDGGDFNLTEFNLGPDFTITDLSFKIDGNPGYDLAIDKLDFVMTGPPPVVPEPMTILGTGFALAALPSLKKAHKNKKAQ